MQNNEEQWSPKPGLILKKRPASGRACAGYKVNDQGDHGEHKQEMNKPACDMKDRKTRNPCEQKHNEQNRPNRHLSLRTADHSLTVL